MNNRLKVHNRLLATGCSNVYYQPPSNVTMKYPCIRYEKSKIINNHADDEVYNQLEQYNITVISKTVDDPIVSKISKFSKCGFDRSYISDNLYHTTFTLQC